MESDRSTIGPQKRIALVAHDNKKQDLLEWAKFNRHVLAQHIVYATGTTGRVLEAELEIDIIKLQSVPWGATSR
jgi:methylglyoxal synthase